MSGSTKMIQEEVNKLIDKHEKWLENRSQGAQLVLRNVNLKGINLSKRTLISSIFENVDLSHSNCESVNFYGDSTNLKNVKFCGANLRKAEFTDCDVQDVDFSNADLEEAELMGFVIAKHLKFDNAKMNKASFIKSSMDFVSFKNASLREANFRRAHINDSSFENADCSNAEFTYATLKDCVVTGAIIEGADFSDVRHLPEEWKQAIGWYSAEQQNIRRIKEMLREEGLR